MEKQNNRNLIAGAPFAGQLAKLMPTPAQRERFVRVVLNAFLSTPTLNDCTQESILKCCFRLAEQQLEPNGVDAYLIPRRAKSGALEAHAQVSYRGMMRMARRIPDIGKLRAEVIYSNDEFDWSMGEVVSHRVTNWNERGEPIGAYAVAYVANEQYSVVMTMREIEACRDRSDGWRAYKAGKTSNPGPWGEFPDEMMKKTALRRLYKWLPASEILPSISEDGTIEDAATVTVGPPEPATEIISTTPEQAPQITAPQETEQPCELARIAQADGFTLDAWNTWALGLKLIDAPCQSFADVPAEVADRCIKARRPMAKALAPKPQNKPTTNETLL